MRVRRIAATVVATVLMAGLGTAGAAPASAANTDLRPDCSVNTSETVYVDTGDTITWYWTGGACNTANTPSPQIYSIALGGSVNVLTILDGLSVGDQSTITSTNGLLPPTIQEWVLVYRPALTTSTPPIPAWVQAYGRDGKDATCREGWNPSWQSWAEPVTGGWVCTRTIPSLG